MLTLVVGGSASGKSEFAEDLIVKTPIFPRYYIATMEPFGPEGAARVARHRALRREKGFETVERYTDLQNLRLPARGAALLECLGNLTANELFSPAGAGTEDGAVRAVVDGVEALLSQCDNLVAVSNEVFAGGRDYLGDTERYLRALAAVNRALARQADQVYEVVCGLACPRKEAAT